MGQGLSCRASYEHALFRAVQIGDLDTVVALLESDPTLLYQNSIDDKLSTLHIAAANGRIEVLSFLLYRSVHPDILNRHKQTPLMLAAMHDKISCVRKLLQAGANDLLALFCLLLRTFGLPPSHPSCCSFEPCCGILGDSLISQMLEMAVDLLRGPTKTG